jgi:hypothetical protein
MEYIDVRPHLYKFNLNDIKYLKPNEFDGKKIIEIKDTSNKNVYIQAPKLYHCIDVLGDILNIPMCGPSKNVDIFIDFIQQMDTKIMKDASANQDVWFSGSDGEIKYKSLIKKASKKLIDEHKLSNDIVRNGILKMDIYDDTKITVNTTDISLDEMKLDVDTTIIFQLYGININKGVFKIVLIPIKINQKYEIVENVCFIDTESDVDEVEDIDEIVISDDDNGSGQIGILNEYSREDETSLQQYVDDRDGMRSPSTLSSSSNDFM